MVLLASTLRASNHPLSRSLYATLEKNEIEPLDSFNEEIGKGITGEKDGFYINKSIKDYGNNDRCIISTKI